MLIKFKNIKIIKLILLIFIGLFALLSLYQGYSIAINFSGDFQWSPTVLFWKNINPYIHYLSGNVDGAIILWQAPNYAHLTYLILTPFIFFEWQTVKHLWAIINILLGIFCAVILCRQFKFGVLDTYIILAIFISSTPFRNVVGNGNHSIIILLLYCALFITNTRLSSILIGFAFFKYSFMFPIAFYILLKKGLKSFILCLVPCILGWIIFSLILNQNPFETLLLPLKVSATSVGQGVADLMTIVGFLNINSVIVSFSIGYLGPIIISFMIAVYLTKKIDNLFCVMAILSTASLILFRHVTYDFIFLLPAFIYAYAHRYAFASKLVIIIIIFNWFGLKLLSPHGVQVAVYRLFGIHNFNMENYLEPLVYMNFLLCIVIIISLCNIYKDIRTISSKS